MSGYHRQARVENAFFRYKSIIGPGLRARSPSGQGREAVLACTILNRMTELAGPSRTASGGDGPEGCERMNQLVSAQQRLEASLGQLLRGVIDRPTNLASPNGLFQKVGGRLRRAAQSPASLTRTHRRVVGPLFALDETRSVSRSFQPPTDRRSTRLSGS